MEVITLIILGVTVLYKMFLELRVFYIQANNKIKEGQGQIRKLEASNKELNDHLSGLKEKHGELNGQHQEKVLTY